ncbi:hypothetical protein BO83DRAFT_378522 [Aspergillus eucalypticola CBS 122712]|uniref:Uncharacterized protein n=1 Tax=Aspergillus eucalypticola (strain CBS 122712 / IBT 29274) TaxID=1448314 RepID=A0A317VGI5_ASPEC|nr:uncharacterized protein BO83DRAFT_378522 [Aspergillus eucalypticola CBS 122712]PWY73483.1 hypothetical protein BO83DRAFT_378522 [Aspergillus eucalypticola CBS 122712]
MHEHGVAVQCKKIGACSAAICTLPPSPYRRKHAAKLHSAVTAMKLGPIMMQLLLVPLGWVG